MQISLQNFKNSLIIFLFLSLPISGFSQQIQISSKFYNIDEDKNLILINKPVNEVNSSFQAPYSSIKLSHTYTFNIPADEIKIGQSYLVTNSANKEYKLYFTSLPIIKIYSSNYIPNSPRVYANFTLTEPNGTEVSSGMGISNRGGTSLWYPKKNYRVEFLENETGNITKDLSLLGMRSDDDWSVDALYIEPLRIRSKTANQLWLQMYDVYYQALEPDAVCGINTEYAELFINNQYKGIYLVSERIDRKQLNLKKYNYNQKIRGELYKAQHWGFATTLSALEKYSNSDDFWGGYYYKHPEEIIDWSNLYDFVDFVANAPNSFFYNNYKSYIEIYNAVDYFIFLNVMRGLDNTGKNTYLAKFDKYEPYFYVPYDLDATFGLFWDGSLAGETSDLLSNRLYDRLLHDCGDNGFYKLMQDRWNELKHTILSAENIISLFENNYYTLLDNGVYEREKIANGDNYNFPDDGFEFITWWIINRLNDLDILFNKPCDSLLVETFDYNEFYSIYPNPASDFFNIDIDEDIVNAQLTITSIYGSVLHQQSVSAGNNFINISHLSSGLYIVNVKNTWVNYSTKLIVQH